MEKEDLKEGEYIDHIERINEEEINIYICLKEGDYFGILKKVENG